mmetsp:Transcript_61692/g.155771  ORF Transcript_61692/g.155771 Transcript_61692/m.155771 type:complete len:206 (+) Transcript_61692:1601-2218(+)
MQGAEERVRLARVLPRGHGRLQLRRLRVPGQGLHRQRLLGALLDRALREPGRDVLGGHQPRLPGLVGPHRGLCSVQRSVWLLGMPRCFEFGGLQLRPVLHHSRQTDDRPRRDTLLVPGQRVGRATRHVQRRGVQAAACAGCGAGVRERWHRLRRGMRLRGRGDRPVLRVHHLQTESREGMLRLRTLLRLHVHVQDAGHGLPGRRR